MKKKYLVTTIAMLAAVSMLTACGNKNENNDSANPTVSVAPTEAPSSDERGDGPSTPAPTEAPAANVAPEQMLNNIHQAIQEAYGSYYAPSVLLQDDDPEVFGEYAQTREEKLKEKFALDSTWYDAIIVEEMAMAVIPDTVILVHATDGNVENVKVAMEKYKETLTANAWYPTTVTRSYAAQTGAIGNYVYFVVITSAVDDTAYTDEASLIEACKENTKLAVETIEGVIDGKITVIPWTATQKIRMAIAKTYVDKYLPNVQIQENASYLHDTLKLDESWYDEALVEIQEDDSSVDKLIVLHATEGQTENIKTALEAYKQVLIEDFAQNAQNLPRVQSALVFTVGDYVFFANLGGALEDPELYGITTEEDLIMYYEAQNGNAEWAVRTYLGIWE